MNDIYDNIRTWADERGIIANGTLRGQALKLAEEFGELAAGIARGDREAIKDAIGDCYVVLTIMDAMESMGVGIDPSEERFLHGNPLARAAEAMAQIIDGAAQEDFPEYHYGEAEEMGSALDTIAGEHGLTPHDCLSHAWEQIKDRKGYMNAQGVFVKEAA